MAQEALRHVEGIDEIDNELEVAAGERAAARPVAAAGAARGRRADAGFADGGQPTRGYLGCGRRPSRRHAAAVGENGSSRRHSAAPAGRAARGRTAASRRRARRSCRCNRTNWPTRRLSQHLDFVQLEDQPVGQVLLQATAQTIG